MPRREVDRLHVHREDAVEGRLVHFQHRLAAVRDAGVVDDDVEAAEPVDRRRDRRLEGGRVTDVAGDAQGSLDQCVVAAAGRQGHVDAGRTERARDGCPDAPARPGDERDSFLASFSIHENT